MSGFREVATWLTERPRQRAGARILQLCVGLALLFRVFTEGPFAAYLWGPNGLGAERKFAQGLLLGVPLDGVFGSLLGTRAVLLALLLGALGLVVGMRSRLVPAVTLVAFTLVSSRLPELSDGGDNVATLVLAYAVFLLPPGAEFRPGGLRVFIHNVAVLAIGAQILVLYGTSGLMKAYGSVWHHGTALYQISQIESFSLPGMRRAFENPLIVTAATYGTVLYQLWFPVAMFSRLRLAWLCLGIWFHVGIALFMGLVTFSTVMIGLEAFLITDEEYVRLSGRATLLGARFRRAPQPSPPTLS